VREFGSIGVGVAAALAWMAVWSVALHVFGIGVFSRRPETHAIRRERIKKMGKLRYIVIFGVLGVGLAFGLAMTTADLYRYGFRSWSFEVGQLLSLSALVGWVHGARTWNANYRDPVPFPPHFPPLK
jgi:hypothetical protein